MDVFGGTNQPRISVSNHPQPAVYMLSNDSVLQQHIGLDSVIYRFYTATGKTIPTRLNNQATRLPITETVVISLVAKNLDDINRLPANAVDVFVQYIRQAMKDKDASALSYWHASFNKNGQLEQSSTKAPFSPEKNSLAPLVQVGFQYARGSFISSAGAGLQYVKHGRYSDHYFRALWDPILLSGKIRPVSWTLTATIFSRLLTCRMKKLLRKTPHILQEIFR